jgi:hypothetical protein
MLTLGGLYDSMQCDVEFEHKLIVCSRTEVNHGKP